MYKTFIKPILDFLQSPSPLQKEVDYWKREQEIALQRYEQMPIEFEQQNIRIGLMSTK